MKKARDFEKVDFLKYGILKKARDFVKSRLFEKYKNAKIKFKRKKSLTRCSLKMAKDYKVPLWWKMTMYRRDEQNPEWYNENLIVIKTRYREVGDQIAKECKRRNILHFYDTHT